MTLTRVKTIAQMDRADASTGAPIFIIGSGRSGTSLLRDILATHPDIASPPGESRFFSIYFNNYGDLQQDDNLERLCVDFFRSDFFKETGLDQEEIRDRLQKGERSYKAFLCTIMDQYVIKTGKKIWAEKTPHHVFYIKDIVSMFPDAKFLFALRDGRDVSLSLRQTNFDPSREFQNVIIRTFVTALWWRKFNVGPIYQCLELPGNSWRFVVYEKLVVENEGYIEKIFKFLSEDWSVSQTDNSFFQDTLIKSNSSFHPVSGLITSEPVNRWKGIMEKDELAAFELMCSNLLTVLGYSVVNTGLFTKAAGLLAGTAIRNPAELLKFWRKNKLMMLSNFLLDRKLHSVDFTDHML